MSAAVSFITQATAERIVALALQGWATSFALKPLSLPLYRFNPNSGQPEARPAQDVTLTWDQPGGATESAGAAARFAGATLKRPAPFDVQVGDAFTVNGLTGTVTAVLPPALGLVKATCRIEVGSAA